MAKDQFSELTDYIVDAFKAAQKNLNLPIDLKYQYLADKKQKTLVKIKKITDNYAVLLNADLLVTFNEEFFDAFDDESKKILIDQELALIEFNTEKGTLKIVKPDLMTSSALVEKYGLKAVKRANQVKTLFSDQQLDQQQGDVIPKK